MLLGHGLGGHVLGLNIGYARPENLTWLLAVVVLPSFVGVIVVAGQVVATCGLVGRARRELLCCRVDGPGFVLDEVDHLSGGCLTFLFGQEQQALKLINSRQ